MSVWVGWFSQKLNRLTGRLLFGRVALRECGWAESLIKRYPSARIPGVGPGKAVYKRTAAVASTEGEKVHTARHALNMGTARHARAATMPRASLEGHLFFGKGVLPKERTEGVPQSEEHLLILKGFHKKKLPYWYNRMFVAQLWKMNMEIHWGSFYVQPT